jgi:hypothetical protein
MVKSVALLRVQSPSNSARFLWCHGRRMAGVR